MCALLHYNFVPNLTFTNLTIYAKYNPKSNATTRLSKTPSIFCCSKTTPPPFSEPPVAIPAPARPVIRRRRRYRKQYPGEKEGITEEMRFIAMKLRDASKVRPRTRTYPGISEADYRSESESESESEEKSRDDENGGEKETWVPSMEGFLRYLVDSKLVFDFIERIVDESNHVSYAYFRKTGLERSEALSKDLDWFRQQDIVIPEPSSPGLTYVKYLEDIADSSPSSFLCHFYNIYFSHIAGGQVIAKQVSEKLLEGKQLEFYTWEGESEELLRGVREKLNMLGEHWAREERNKCLREATKSFRYLGQIVRLIILYN